jgi:sporulation protein YabP
MEEKQAIGQHRLTLNNRKTGCFTGVLDVLSFDLNEILLETELGMLHVKGKDLHVNRLNLEKGEVEIEGQVEAIQYSQVPALKNKSTVLGKLFG